jgi:hypothetical protein
VSCVRPHWPCSDVPRQQAAMVAHSAAAVAVKVSLAWAVAGWRAASAANSAVEACGRACAGPSRNKPTGVGRHSRSSTWLSGAVLADNPAMIISSPARRGAAATCVARGCRWPINAWPGVARSCCGWFPDGRAGVDLPSGRQQRRPRGETQLRHRPAAALPLGERATGQPARARRGLGRLVSLWVGWPVEAVRWVRWRTRRSRFGLWSRRRSRPPCPSRGRAHHQS